MLNWRLIPLLQASGKVQMAIDRWLLQQHHLGYPPTLRFYTWNPAAISLGYHQRRYPLFWNDLPVDLVRRPTGGRAVLHQGDLTYAVVTSGLKGSRTQIYEQICRFLLQGWQELGVSLHYGSAGRDYIRNPNCFGMATGADLVTDTGIKLIGSAQLRQGEAILQHGSMRLAPDGDLLAQVFGEVPQRAVISLPLEIIIETLTKSAKKCFEMQLIVQPLSELEWQEILAMPPLESIVLK